MRKLNPQVEIGMFAHYRVTDDFTFSYYYCECHRGELLENKLVKIVGTCFSFPLPEACKVESIERSECPIHGGHHRYDVWSANLKVLSSHEIVLYRLERSGT